MHLVYIFLFLNLFIYFSVRFIYNLILFSQPLMKNLLLTRFQNTLAVLMTVAVLFSCNQVETFEIDDLNLNQEVLDRDGVTLTALNPNFMDFLNVYQVDACENFCIIPDDPTTYHVLSGRETYNPQIYVDYSVYHDDEKIYYNFTIAASNSSSPTIASVNGVPVGETSYSIEFDLPEDWEGCDLVERSFTVVRAGGGGGATGLTIETAYRLIPICVEEPDDLCPEDFSYERSGDDNNTILFKFTPKATLAFAEIQITTPQIADWESLDGKNYEEFGAGANGGLRWIGDLVCGEEITFELRFTPEACGQGNPNVNLVSTFNVKDLGGNKLTGQPIRSECISG